MVAWDRVCALTRNGGMRILDLETQNQALLTKWLWNLDSDNSGMWTQTLNPLYGVNNHAHLNINPRYSFLSLTELAGFYKVSTISPQEESEVARQQP